MFNIISIISIGLGIAGCIMAVFKVFGHKSPRYLIPLSAGLAMVIFTIWNEYSWYGRSVETLPDDVIVVKELPASSMLYPWTLVFPSVEKYILMDTLKIQRHKTHQDFVMAETAVISRYADPLRGLHMFNCALGTRADISPTTKFDDQGMPIDVTWIKEDTLGVMYTRVCSQ